MKTTPPPASAARIPIVVGVTGHRDIDPGNRKLNGELADLFARLRSAYPDSPFIILSPLAEGADRLVARKAMELLDAELVAALPMHAEEYRKDFGTPASRQEFDELLGRASHVYTMPGGGRGEFQAGVDDVRNAQYSRVGAFVARYAQILVAIWDGEAPLGKGGTKHVVDWVQAGRIPVDQLHPSGFGSARGYASFYASPLEEHEPGVAYWIPYRNRKSPDRSMHQAEEWRWLENRSAARPHGFAEDPVSRQIDALNREMRVSPAESAYPLPVAEALTLTRDGSLAKLASLFSFCDASSLADNARSRRFLLAIFWSFLLAVMSFALMDLHFAFAVPFVLAFGAMSLIGWRAGVSQAKERYVERRILAEGLRVLFHWRVAGLRDSVAARYLPHLRHELGWVREALANIELSYGTAFYLGSASREDLGQDNPRLGFVRERWLADQQRFYAKNCPKYERKSARFHAWETAGYRAALAVVVVCIAGWLAGPWFSPDALLLEHPWMAFSRPWADLPALSLLLHSPQLGCLQLVLGFLLSCTALMVFCRERGAYGELAENYAYTERMFAIAAGSLKAENIATLPPAVLQEAVFEIGRVALTEQGHWHGIQKSLPLSAPKATG